MPNTVLSTSQKKHFRQIGHGLKPIVTIGSNGLSDNVLNELDRAFADHELIKIKLAIADRELRGQVIEELCTRCGAQCIQSIGKVVLVYRANPRANPKLSNVLR